MLKQRPMALPLLAEIVVELVRVRLWLRSPWRARCLARPALGRRRSVDRGRLERLVGTIAGLGPRPASCLERSVALRNVLARRGIESELQIGVRFDGDRLEGHAWLAQAPQSSFEGFLPLRRASGNEP